jgi:hypothetical protein
VSLESQLESLTNSKHAEMERSISLRNRGTKTAHSYWWIQTKVRSTWIGLVGFCLRYLWRGLASSRDLTGRGMLA